MCHVLSLSHGVLLGHLARSSKGLLGLPSSPCVLRIE
jgi:hypothetical protein